jgi:hypothetical protein
MAEFEGTSLMKRIFVPPDACSGAGIMLPTYCLSRREWTVKDVSGIFGPLMLCFLKHFLAFTDRKNQSSNYSDLQ